MRKDWALLKRQINMTVAVLSVATFVFAVVAPMPAQAVDNCDPNAADLDYHCQIDECDTVAVKTETQHYDACRQECPANAQTLGAQAGAGVYILGDSITVRTAAKYKELFGAKGITPTISAVSGRSWISGGNPAQGAEGTQGPGQFAVDVDAAAIKGASDVVIGLGTNGFAKDNPIGQIVDKIKSINENAHLWWIDVAAPNPAVVYFNKQLQDESKGGKFTVLPWHEVVDSGSDGTHNPKGLLEDGVNPSNPDGVNMLGNLVFSTITGTTNPTINSATGQPCVCKQSNTSNLVGSDEQEKAFNFFLSKGLGPVQAAAIVGNMMAESGDHLRTTVTNSIGAHGIVQWLHGRLDSERRFAGDRDADDFTVQLEFVWVELTGPYKSSTLEPIKAINVDIDKGLAIDKATGIFNDNYEISGDHSGVRERNARGLFEKYGSNSPVAGAVSNGCGT